MESFEKDYKQHLKLTSRYGPSSDDESQAQREELEHPPLFSSDVCRQLDRCPSTQYGLLGRQVSGNPSGPANTITGSINPNMVYSNTREPWSAFICGSQGSGKSYTLASLLENCVLPSSKATKNRSPLAAMAFHYDQFTSFSSTQYCELAYLCSSGIDVRIFVSPSNYQRMHRLYRNLPGLKEGVPRPRVVPLRLREKQLSIENILTMMNVKEGESTPLYLAILRKILRDWAIENQGREGIDYASFKRALGQQQFADGQMKMLNLRLELLDELLGINKSSKITSKADVLDDMWNFKPSSLTIVDLSSPVVSVEDACAIFTICVNLFLANRSQVGRVLVMDEAHKFLTRTGEAEKLTEQLMAIIRQQRHLGARVMIATQEPTLDTRLLDLCDVTIVHRFRSPAWFAVLQNHLAGSRRGSGKESELREIFDKILGLETGTALVFAPTAFLHVVTDENDIDGGMAEKKITRLKDDYIKVRIRQRLTHDGGKSMMADNNLKIAQKPPKSASPPTEPSLTDEDETSTSFATASDDGGVNT